MAHKAKQIEIGPKFLLWWREGDSETSSVQKGVDKWIMKTRQGEYFSLFYPKKVSFCCIILSFIILNSI